MKTSIFEIGREYLDILAELEDNGGELTEELQEALAVNESDFEKKVEDYNVVMSHFQDEIDRNKLMIASLSAKNRAKEYILNNLKENLKQVLFKVGDIKTSKTTGRTSYFKEFANIGLKIQSSPSASVKIMDDFENPDYGKYVIAGTVSKDKLMQVKALLQDTKTEFKPDKKKIKEAIESGTEVPDAEIIVNYNVKIK